MSQIDWIALSNMRVSPFYSNEGDFVSNIEGAKTLHNRIIGFVSNVVGQKIPHTAKFE